MTVAPDCAVAKEQRSDTKHSKRHIPVKTVLVSKFIQTSARVLIFSCHHERWRKNGLGIVAKISDRRFLRYATARRFGQGLVVATD